jgi:hypothetical protein
MRWRSRPPDAQETAADPEMCQKSIAFPVPLAV